MFFINLSKEQYNKIAMQKAPKSKTFKNTLSAFLSGGIICVLGQGINQFYLMMLDKKEAATATSITLIFLGAFLALIGVYKYLAKFSGGGTLIPITGFANSIVAAATEFKSEGYVFGTSVKMFIIAGPVLVFGTVSAVVYGLILFLLGVLS